MSNYQSTSYNVSDEGQDTSLAFETIGDDPGEDFALKAWHYIELPDGQLVKHSVRFTDDDVRGMQAFLNDQYGGNRGALKPGVTYPFKDGNVLVIGPECFIHMDGQVLSYQGQNFVPQSAQTQIDGANAQYFHDGWAAALQEFALQAGYAGSANQAMVWLDQQVGLARLQREQYDAQGHPVDPQPTDNELPGMWEQSDFSGGEADTANQVARQCPHISNNVRCSYAEHGPETMHSFQTALTPAASAPAADVSPKRKRRTKLEMAFDKAKESGNAEELQAAAVALREKDPANPRLQEQSALAPAVQEAQADFQSAGQVLIDAANTAGHDVPGFAPEPPAGTPVAAPWSQNADGSASFNPMAAAQAAGQNYLQQSEHPVNQQFNEWANNLPGEHLQDSVVMTPEQHAAAGFPCPVHSADGRPCQRPAGHDIATPINPEPKPHVFATIPSMLTQPGQAPGGQFPAFQPPTAPSLESLEYQVDPTPGTAPVAPWAQS